MLWKSAPPLAADRLLASLAMVPSLEIFRRPDFTPCLHSLLMSYPGCSQYSYCGSSTTYCKVGCQSGFGTCASSSSQSSSSTVSIHSSTVSTHSSSKSSSVASASSSPALKLTTNARCGAGFGTTCQNSRWGNCCSQYSYW